MKNKLAVVGLAAGLVGGAAAGLALTVPNLATAQTSTTTTAPAASSPSTTADTTDRGDTPTRGDKPERGDKLRETLAPLVADGTITQEQADKVIAAIEAARPERGAGIGRHLLGESLEAAANALGMTQEELRTALQADKTLAAIAAEKGVEVQKVIDALVAEAKDRLDALVAEGKLTQAQADEQLTAATERITKVVNGELPLRGGRGGRHGGPGHDSQESAPTTAAAS